MRIIAVPEAEQKSTIAGGSFHMTYRIATIVLVLLAAGCMTATAQNFQTGKFTVDRTVPNYSLDQGSGDRTITLEVAFQKGFEEKPQVALSVTGADVGKDSNLRYEVKTISVSRDGFVIQVRTWADTKIHSLGGSWVAYAPK